MSTSLAQPISSISSVDNLDTITLTTGSSSYDTITIDPNYSFQYNTGNTISYSSAYTISGPISGSSTNQINTISTVNINDFKITMPEEWVDCFPDFDRIEKMCREYPGLKIAYDQFKTVYALVKGDYDTPKDQRVKP